MHFDDSRPCVVVAPHLAYPLWRGNDILIDRRWSEFSRFVPWVEIVGESTVRRFVDGHLAAERRFRNKQRGRVTAAARTVMFGTHYLLEKFVTPGFREVVEKTLGSDDYGTVVLSYLVTRLALPDGFRPRGGVLCIETHNDERRWFADVAFSTRNPLTRVAARRSSGWLALRGASLCAGALLCHVSQADAEAYSELCPGSPSVVLPPGVDLPVAEAVEGLAAGDRVRLLFVGSLGVNMNADALDHFARRFWPEIVSKLGADVEFVVLGSGPTRRVRRLCERHGWRLEANAPAAVRDECYRRASFTVMPFPYATGAKLKLVESSAHGVPFLVTRPVAHQMPDVPELCLVSDEPGEWLSHLVRVRARGITIDDRRGLRALVEAHSWSNNARILVENLKGLAASGAGTLS